MTLRRGVVAVALLVGAAATPWLAAAPAQAASCSGSGGVTVVVDFAELGGGVTAGCDGSVDGQRARAILADAGYSLTMATKSAGFVCRVNGVPASDPCVEAAPADRYWSVWWADGKGGSWVYSSRGVDSLRVPDGGYLAMAWHQGSGKSSPPNTVPVSRVAPTKQPVPTKKPAPAPTKDPRPAPTKKPGSEPTGGAIPTPNATGAPTPSASSSADPTAAPGVSPSATSGSASDTPSPGESVAVDPDLPDADQITAGPDDVAPAAADSGAGLPVWVAPAVLVVLLAGVGVVVVRRRRT